jgi:hypothetical protein
MIMNKLMEPYWQGAHDWSSLKLTPDIEKILAAHIADLSDDEDSHVHLLDLGIEKDLLRYGLRITARLFELYSISEPTSPLEAFISLDDGSELDDWEAAEDEPWFDCAIHFHIKLDDAAQFMDPATIERCIQPVIIVDSNDTLFSKNLFRD